MEKGMISYLRKVVFWLVLLAIVLVSIFPVLWLVTASLKTFVDVFALPPKFIFRPTLVNYQEVFFGKRIQLFWMNSIIVAFAATVIALVIGVPGAYSLAQFEFRGKKNIGIFILSVRIAPPIMSLLPLFVIFSRLHLVGTRVSLVIMYIVFNLPLSVWIMQVFFRDVPRELREAAIMDGCGEFRTFLSIMVPLVQNGLLATTVLCMIQSWNEYLFALVLSGQDTQTLPVAITSFMTFQGIEWGPISAAGVVVMLPMILFGLLSQKNLVRGMTLGAVKG
ncbi:MAG: carbohydrate ABC transporter permease [Chloroflexi bacterium]|nr:carbohydrate ABC transporter permease [Chloroflexota bacterium]